ncbi:MAG: hypothetical protein Kow0068_14260 [Marinilabiliales bacterium]
MKTLIFTTLIVLLSSFLFAQISESENTFGGALPENGLAIMQNTNGYIVGGYTESFGNGGKDFYLIQLDYNGDTLFTNFFGASLDDAIKSISQYAPMSKGGAAGNYIVTAGYTTNSDKDIYFAEYDDLGAIMYTPKFYDFGYGDDEIHKLRFFELGYTHAVGYITNSAYNKDLFISVIEDDYLDFDTTNIAFYGGPGDEEAFDICGTNQSSNKYITGYTTSSGAGGMDLLALAYAEDIYATLIYDTVFARTYGGPGDECGKSIIVNDLYYTIYIAGYTTSYGAGGKDIYLLALDMYNGDTIWTRTFGHTLDDEPMGMIQPNDTTLLLFGYTTNETTLDKDFYILSFNINGNLQYERIWGDPGVDEVINDIYGGMCNFMITGEKDGDLYISVKNLLYMDVNVTDISCNGMTDGSIELIPYNLIPSNFDLNWYDTTAANLGYNNLLLDTLGAGIYYYNLYDFSTSCFYVDTFIFTDPPIINYTGGTTTASCGGTCDGEAFVNVTGGIPPYSYIWSDGQTTDTATNLCLGTYDITVTDSHGCTITYSDTVGELAMAYISGIINPTSLGAIPDGYCYVILLKEEGFADWDTMAVESLISSQYTFFDVYPGNYLIKFETDTSLIGFDNILDTYHDSSYTWQLATPISLACEDTINLITTMFEMTPIGTGNGTISGTIGYWDGTKNIGEPVPGAEVYIEQEPNDQPILSTETDTSGYYEFGDIPLGSNYYLVVDIPGYPQISTYNNIDITSSDTLYTNLNFYVDTTNGSEGIYIDNTTGISKQPINKPHIYPNPFNEIVNIDFEIDENNYYSIELINIKGEVLYNEKQFANNSGQIHKYLTVKDKGIYFIKLQIDNNIYLKKVIAIE